VHRDDWPDFEAFDPSAYDVELRRPAARQWMRRAREELGSVYEFTAVSHALAACRVPLEILGCLSRLITDEVRHAELCARMGHACWPEGVAANEEIFDFPPPRMPFPEPPVLDRETDDVAALLRWAADAILCSCCIGETLSRPLFESSATVCTDPVCEAVLRQILRDEHLHATFGWEALEELWARLNDEDRSWLQKRLSKRLAGFERSCAAGIELKDLADTEVAIEPGDPAEPNLAILTRHQYAMVFYSTLESEILPRFDDLGLDAEAAWAARG
jgi:rubrerythrin